MRIILLLSPTSYRTAAFLGAARQLGIDVVKVVDTPQGIAGPATATLALDFQDEEGSARAIQAYARQHPVKDVCSSDRRRGHTRSGADERIVGPAL